MHAVQNGNEKNLLFKTWGGLGDEICTEPTLRYALNTFKDCDISLAAERPELFRHLNFKRVFDLKIEKPIWENYLCFETITPPQHFMFNYIAHMVTNCVDYPSICALRCQLPIAEKEIKIFPNEREIQEAKKRLPSNGVIVHAGRHWQSKTFPKSWWDEVISRLYNNGALPVLIGADTDDNRGTVDVDASFCVDLRNKMTIMETVALLQQAKVLLTNDSAPLHMAASGDAWIGYVATCKHYDLITHWRRGQWGYRMQNFGKGGIWEIINHLPNTDQEVSAERVPEEYLEKWLPQPSEMSDWAIAKLHQ